jgi:uncharacterized tellurite resistance protein B-like protein
VFDDFFSNDDEPDTLDPTALSMEDQKAFYGSLFAMAAADDTVEREEMELIFETLDLEGLDEEDRREVHGYLMDPPDFSECLEELRDTDEALRHGLVLNLIEVVIADDLTHEREEEYIAEAQEKLEVSDEQVEEMKNFAQEVKRIRERGIDDDHAKDALKEAAAGMAGVGVPVGAIAFSGTVAGLGAAGITSGLAALALGLGMVPGIGVAILMGSGVYLLLRRLLDIRNQSKKEEYRKERERKTQLAIQNLQETISTLVDQLDDLQEDAANAEANKEAVEKLNDRLRKLKQLLNRREEQLASA